MTAFYWSYCSSSFFSSASPPTSIVFSLLEFSFSESGIEFRIVSKELFIIAMLSKLSMLIFSGSLLLICIALKPMLRSCVRVLDTNSGLIQLELDSELLDVLTKFLIFLRFCSMGDISPESCIPLELPSFNSSLSNVVSSHVCSVMIVNLSMSLSYFSSITIGERAWLCLPLCYIIVLIIKFFNL